MRSVNCLIVTAALGILDITCISASALAPGLLDPADQPMFVEPAVNALGSLVSNTGNQVSIVACQISQQTGIINPSTGRKLQTSVWGYGTSTDTASWPGPTLTSVKGKVFTVKWINELRGVQHPFTSLTGYSIVDKTLHWAYSIPGYNSSSIKNNNVPIVVHLHGSRSGQPEDGHPEAFFTPDFELKGPTYATAVYKYDNDQPASTLWYHDHVLGITRLNVYAGLAGFYILRDSVDTGVKGNSLNLPVYPYEAAFAIQDRMFKKNGELFFPAYLGDPFSEEYLADVQLPASKPSDPFYPRFGPTTFPEFFGDFMLVNGKIWPRMDVEPRKYRLRFLNGCDSRFLVICFSVEKSSVKIPYTLIGTDQGLLNAPLTGIRSSVIEPGSRIDILIDFSSYSNMRIIMSNAGGDQPFTGSIPGEKLFSRTDKIMAFNVSLPKNGVDVGALQKFPQISAIGKQVLTRRVALFEGTDKYGRIQPVLGGQLVSSGPIVSRSWKDAITENPSLNTIEQWEIYNFTPDAHPVHLHLVPLTVIGRYKIPFDSNADAEGMLPTSAKPKGNGVYLEPIELNDKMGKAYRAIFPNYFKPSINATEVKLGQEYAAEAGGRKDIVTVLPRQVTVVRALFDRAGNFMWHCHILSHEDHEMMREYKVS